MPTQVLTWDDTPPSMNQKSSGYGANHHVAGRTKKNWEGIAMVMLLQAKVPKDLRWVRASAVMRFPDKRRRDEGNFRMVIEKALGDAMVGGGWLPDDTPDLYRFTGVEFDPEKGPKQTTITLDYELAGA
jgi:hypothetical protein